MENRYKLIAINEYEPNVYAKCIDMYLIYDTEDVNNIYISKESGFSKIKSLLFLKCIKLKPFVLENLYSIVRTRILDNIIEDLHYKIFWDYIDQKTLDMIRDYFHLIGFKRLN
jgi:hypothetical protein